MYFGFTELKKCSYLIFLFVVFLTLTPDKATAQYNTARLTVLSGGNIPFNFNSIEKYENGIEITNGTLLGITIVDIPSEFVPPFAPNSTLAGWSLEFQSFNGQTTILGGGTNTLDLNTIQVQATNQLGLAPTINATYTGYQDLSVAGNVLFSTTDAAHLNTDFSTHQINLTYQCGMANGSLLGETPDYYVVEIEVLLIPSF